MTVLSVTERVYKPMMTTADRIIIGCIFGIAAGMAYLGLTGMPYLASSSIFLLCGLGFFYLISAYWHIRRKEKKSERLNHRSDTGGSWKK